MNALLNRVDGMLDSIVFGVKYSELTEKFLVYGFVPERESRALFKRTFNPYNLWKFTGGYLTYDKTNKQCMLAVGPILQLVCYECLSKSKEIEDFMRIFPNDTKIYPLKISGDIGRIKLSHPDPNQSTFIEFNATTPIMR